VVNVQGDHPGIDPDHVDIALRIAASNAGEDVVTLCTPIRSSAELLDPGVVKCVADKDNYAMYFSRAPIPFRRRDATGERSLLDIEDGKEAALGGTTSPSLGMRHLGIYAFRADVLVNEIARMEPCVVEQEESLEQLRWMFHGTRVRVEVVDRAARSIDTKEDIEKFIREQQVLANPTSSGARDFGR
jgi:3-deoxy-manno-octulosonate cytidylyltransferase (CMP-KDO synthetase)